MTTQELIAASIKYLANTYARFPMAWCGAAACASGTRTGRSTWIAWGGSRWTPCAQASLDDAEEVARFLRIPMTTIAVSPMADGYFERFPDMDRGRKGNLLALRELALLRTAERVDAQMQSYRELKGVREVWPAAERIVVCVGPNPHSVRLIRAAKRMAAGLRAERIAVHVEAPSKVKPSDSDLRQLAESMSLAESLGAETVTLSGYKASEEILSYARDRNATKIIIGKPNG